MKHWQAAVCFTHTYTHTDTHTLSECPCVWGRKASVGWRKCRGEQPTASVLAVWGTVCLFVRACLGLFLRLFSCVGQISKLLPLSFLGTPPIPHLLSSHTPRELPLSPWWRRRASWVVGVSLHVAGRHHFDLHTQMGENLSAMPPLAVIMSCHPSCCQVGVWWCGWMVLWSSPWQRYIFIFSLILTVKTVYSVGARFWGPQASNLFTACGWIWLCQ